MLNARLRRPIILTRGQSVLSLADSAESPLYRHSSISPRAHACWRAQAFEVGPRRTGRHPKKRAADNHDRDRRRRPVTLCFGCHLFHYYLFCVLTFSHCRAATCDHRCLSACLNIICVTNAAREDFQGRICPAVLNR